MIKGVEQLDEEQQSGIMLFMLLKMERNIMGLKCLEYGLKNHLD